MSELDKDSIERSERLLKSRRFLPLFITQFLGAFNDNLFKLAMLMLFTYQLSDQTEIGADVLNNMAAGIFILPFFLFSALAGQLADKYSKSVAIRHIKLAEIILMVLGAIGFFMGHLWGLMVILFLMGVQSAFFGPIKYAMLPELLKERELINGNALIEAATFIAILLGMIIGGSLIFMDGGLYWTTAMTIGCAILGWFTAKQVPATKAVKPNLIINLNLITATFDIIKTAKGNRPVLRSIMAISWFWLFGSLVLTQFPAFTENELGGAPAIVSWFLALFTIGIAIGSGLCAKMLKGQISARYSPWAAGVMAIASIDLYFASIGVTKASDTLIPLAEFLMTADYWRISIDLAIIAVAGGVYIVPLYTILQEKSEPSVRSRMIAANNIVNSGFMALGAGVAIIILGQELKVQHVLLITGLFNLVIALLLIRFPASD